MVTIAKDAPQQLYRSVFAKLKGDTDLLTLLGALVPDNPRIYQTYINFNTSLEFKEDVWITYNLASDSPMDVEQMQDVHEMVLDVHVWMRGPSTDRAEEVEARIRELLDNGDLSHEFLQSWYCHFAGYRKIYEMTPDLTHIITNYNVMCMAVRP